MAPFISVTHRTAHAAGNCDFAREDYVAKCTLASGELSVACLDNSFHNIDAQISAKLTELNKGSGSRSGKLAHQSYEFEELYRKKFCEGVWRGAIEFWSIFENKEAGCTKQLTSNEKQILSAIAATCNVALWGNFSISSSSDIASTSNL